MQAKGLASKLSRSAILWRHRRGARHIKSWVKRARVQSEWLPLCERPPCSVVPVRKVFEWRDAALGASAELQTPSSQDGDPSSRELQARSFRSSTDMRWRDCCWRDLEIESHKWKSKKENGKEDGDGEREEECLQMRLTLEDLAELWRKRIHERVPIQYLTNTAHWRDVMLCVGPGILIPRPETEMLIDLAEQHVKKKADDGGSPWMDMGTGSGAIAIALAKMLGKGSKVFAVDVNPAAVQCARKNAHRCGVASQVVGWDSWWFGNLSHLKGKLGGIVSNPPYIPRADIENLQPEVGRHEPVLALDGGAGDGTECLKEILKSSALFLIRGGFLGLETNGGVQSKTTTEALLETGFFEDVCIHSDYYGVQRFVTARRI